MRSAVPILLYDIDGTLLRVKRDFLLGLISEQLKAFNVQKPEKRVKSFAGRTDRGIFMELIGNRPDAEVLFNQLKERYSAAMLKHLMPNHINPISDAIDSARQAKYAGFEVGLCTGNFREVALKKVETAGLKDVFTFGGFGGRHEDRNLLPGEADREFRKLHGRRPEVHDYVIIGDTPGDIKCARYFGAAAVAVTTGSFSREELSVHRPDLLLDSLKNPPSWLNKLGFEVG